MRLDDSEADPIVAIAVEPAEVMLASGGAQQLRVTTRDPSGRRRCVTVEAQFQSNNPSIAGVDGDGLIRRDGRSGRGRDPGPVPGARRRLSRDAAARDWRVRTDRRSGTSSTAWFGTS